MNKLTSDQRETVIEALRNGYTKAGAAKVANVTYRMVTKEERSSLLFARRVRVAVEEGKGAIGDIAIERIKWLASEQNKDVRSRLTANAMLANWTVPGFRGVQEVRTEHKHEVKVISAVPRPKYDAIVEPPEVKELPSGEQSLADAIEQGIVSTDKSRRDKNG